MSSEHERASEREVERQANQAFVWIIVVAVLVILFFWFIGWEAIFG